MLTVVVASSKGGAGKTTLATNLAAALAAEGLDTVLVDADRQQSALRWCEKRALTTAAPVLGLAGVRRNWRRQVPEDADAVIIDTAAGVTPAGLQPWLDGASALLVPVLPSAIDLEAADAYLAALAALPQAGSGIPAVAVVANRLRPWTRASQRALEEMQRLPFPLRARLRDTQGVVLANALGRGLFDYRSGQVRQHQEDWTDLLRWLHALA